MPEPPFRQSPPAIGQRGAPTIVPRPLASGASRLAVGLALLTAAGAAWPASWGFQPSAGAGAIFESNPNYRGDETKSSATGIGFNAMLDIFAETPRSRWTFQPSIRVNIYNDDEEERLDGENYYFPLTARYRGQRAEYGFSSRYSQSPTRDAEFEPAVPDDPDNPPPPGSGRTNFLDDDQQYVSVDPYVRYSITPVDSLSLSGGYAEVSYDKSDLTLQPGYENYSADMTYQHSFDAKNFLSASLYGSSFTSTQPCRVPRIQDPFPPPDDTCGPAFAPQQLGTPVTNDTDSYGVSLGYQYAKSGTESISVIAGTTRSDFAIKNLRTNGLPCYDPALGSFVPCRVEGSETNFVGELSYSIRSRDTTSTVSVGRSLQPSSDGATVTQDNVRAYWIHSISPRLNVSTGLTLIQSEFVGSTSNGQVRERFKREYWRVSAGASWALTQHWSIRGTYDLVDSGYGSVSSEQNHVVELFIQYTGLQRRGWPW